ncbi:MAG: DNA polymerase/3'-5' exonuclease PolX [Desulfosalsimonadaceae bacterium]
MPTQNTDVANVLTRVADLLEIQGANPFRVRAYRNAARTVSSMTHNVSEMTESDLAELSGIGKDLAGKIREIADTGTLSQLDEIEHQLPAGLGKLMKIPGLGPKRVKAIYQGLGVSDLKSLKKAAENEKIRDLEGFGQKTEQHILEELEKHKEGPGRLKLFEAEQRAAPYVDYMKASGNIKEITVAGSFRRRKETVGDLDILVTCKKSADAMDRFVGYEDVQKVISKGKTRSTVVLRSGLQVDLRVMPQVSYGAALHYFTGSKAHSIAIRKIGVKKKLKINEYGVFKGKERVAGKTEKEVYDQVGLPFIEPELREGHGEIEAAQNNKLPDLITLDDLRGELHSHTRATDGKSTMEEMARAAKDRGYDYLAVTDHSRKVAMAKGLNAKRLADQIKDIDKLNGKLNGITLLKGIEVDILEDGSLDLPDDILKELDLRICSVHYNRGLSRKKQTERIVRAMDNPYFNILAHPTGRMINEREPLDLDMEKLMEAAVERNCFMEINAHPERLDLSDRYCRMAKQMKLKLAISTDAHSEMELDFIRFGVDQARRGWLEPDDVINTRSLKDVKTLCQPKK